MGLPADNTVDGKVSWEIGRGIMLIHPRGSILSSTVSHSCPLCR